MRYAGLVLGILGGLAAGALGAKWLSDAREMSAQIETLRELGADTGDITRLTIGAWLLIGALLAGIAGGVLALMGKGKIAGGVLMASAVLPACFAPASLIFTWMLVAGAIVSFFVRPRPQPQPAMA